MPYISQLVTPLYEITQMFDPFPFSFTTSLERVKGIKTYRAPPLYSNGSEERYMRTHDYLGVHSLRYRQSENGEIPADGICVASQIFLRYQLNPDRPPHMPPPKNAADYPYRNQRPNLRTVYLEPVPLKAPMEKMEWDAMDSANVSCGINVYTLRSGVFADFPPLKGPMDICEGEDVALIFSTIPDVRKKLQHSFGYGSNSPTFIVDDAFVSWDTFGLVSLNELHERGLLVCECSYDDAFDYIL